MTEIPNTLFSETQRKELSADEKIVKKQKDAVQKWKNDLDAGILDIESQNKDHLRDLMIDALGYPRDEIKAETGEKNTRLDYSYTPDSRIGGVLFELKSRDKKPFKPQGYTKKEQDTPVDQAITYIEKNPHISYAIVSNFEEFVLITREDLRSQCYHFKFPPKGMKLLDSEIQEFVHFFSKNGIENGFIEKAKKATEREEDTITDDFYQLYHQTRLMLIHAFNDKKRIEYSDAIKITQTYLNRLIFLFFAEDNNLIKKRAFTDGILSILNSNNVREKSTDISGYVQTLFSWMDEGSDEIDNKLGFNGEFFKEPIDRNAFFYDFQTLEFFKDITKKVKVPKKIKLNKENQIAIDRYNGKVNPIIINFLKMASYDFKQKDSDDTYDKDIDASDEQISINILGYIFEQSIGDLEELQNKKSPQRKKDGVFYTPEYITRHICKNSIIPYLSKNGATESHQLIIEYKDNIQELEGKIDEIKILDPACGSGAFLVQAVDVLTTIFDEIQNFKEKQGAYVISKKGQKESGIAKQSTFDKEHETDKARRKLIQNNIYGVDINPESVEITKLSLFLKIATKNKRLIGLSQRIQVGNSIIDDDTLDKRSFNWETRFAEILDPKYGEKFDIIIENPPYVQLSLNKNLSKNVKEFLLNRYKSSMGRLNTFGFFLKLGIGMLKENGRLGFIVPNTVLTQDYYTELRMSILDTCEIKSIVNFSKLPFKDAVVENTIPMLKKSKNKEKRENNEITIFESDKNLNFIKQKTILQSDYLKNKNCAFIIQSDKLSTKIRIKIEQDSSSLKQHLDVNQAIALRYERARWVTTDGTAKNAKPLLVGGKNINRYSLNWDGTFLKYDLKGIHSCKTETIFLSKEKLIFRRVANRLTATLDTNQFYGLNTLVIMNLKLEEEHNLRYFLGIFNFKLMTYYYQKVFASTKKIFSEVGARQVESLPIKFGSPKIQELVIKKVDELLTLNKSLVDLKKKFSNRISQNFNPQKLSKLENIEKLDFNQFHNQLKKQKITLSLEQQDKWEEYFLSKKKEILINIHKTIKIDDELDKLIYQIYDLTENDIKIIEENY